MSYDLMVFDKVSAPRNRTDFMDWYEEQTEWTEDHDYENQLYTTAALRNWFMDMISVFPPLNGPYATEDFDNLRATDYCIGRTVIYVAFAWSEAELAYSTMKLLAAKHCIGFFDVSSSNGEIVHPV
jgi:hypothetical protein